MKLYHKIGRIATTALCLFMALIMFVKPASAAYSTLDLNSYLSVYTYVNLNGVVTNDMEVSTEDNGIHMVTASFTLNSSLRGITYTSALYLYGVAGYSISIPINIPDGRDIRGFSVSAVESVSNDFQVTVLRSATRDNNNLNFGISTMFTDYYFDTRQSTFCGNISITFEVTYYYNENNVPTSEMTPTTGNSTIRSQGVFIDSGALPNSAKGLGGIISEAVKFAFYQYEVDDYLQLYATAMNTATSQLGTVNSYLSSLYYLLDTIKAQDMSAYTSIMNYIASQIANDNVLAQELEDNLNSLLTGTYMSGVVRDVGDILVDIMNHLIGFRNQNHEDISSFASENAYNLQYIQQLLNTIINAHASEASEVNSQAESQVDALSELESQLAIPSASADAAFNAIQDNIPPISQQGELFYYLKPNYTFIGIILTLCVSFGTIGFILYGKG